jgi:hypothetical protein
VSCRLGEACQRACRRFAAAAFESCAGALRRRLSPGGGGIVRNMDVTPDGNPVTAHSLSNQVGLVTVQ